jgi:hypothetical protein
MIQSTLTESETESFVVKNDHIRELAEELCRLVIGTPSESRPTALLWLCLVPARRVSEILVILDRPGREYHISYPSVRCCSLNVEELIPQVGLGRD